MSQQSNDSSKVNLALQQAIAAILGDRPIAYHAILARALNSVTAGVLLSQLLYWVPRAQHPEGWVWKTQEEIYEETALGRREQETARRVLKAAGIIEERLAGVPARLHFRVNMERLIGMLSDYQGHPPGGLQSGSVPVTGEINAAAFQFGGKRQSSLAETSDQERAKAPYQNVRKRHTYITENTAETTTENSLETTFNSNLATQQSKPQRKTSSRPANIPLPLSEGRTPPNHLSDGKKSPTAEPKGASRSGLTSIGQALARRSDPVLKTGPQRRSEGPRTAASADAISEDLAEPIPIADGPGRRPRGRPRKEPQTEYLDIVTAEIARELHDENVGSDVVQMRNLLRASGLDEDTFVARLYEARSITRQRANISMSAVGLEGVRNRFPYMVAVLKRDLLGMEEDEAGPRPPVQREAGER